MYKTNHSIKMVRLTKFGNNKGWKDSLSLLNVGTVPLFNLLSIETLPISNLLLKVMVRNVNFEEIQCNDCIALFNNKLRAAICNF